jgi:hypothetical protein
MKAWFRTDTIENIGNTKVADMSQSEARIIPGFTEYWMDFAPFAMDLIRLCFPLAYNTALPNKLTHDRMLSILSEASMTVKESPTDMPGTEKLVKNLKASLKRNESCDPPVPTRRRKRKLEKV